MTESGALQILIAEPDDFSERAVQILRAVGDATLLNWPPDRVQQALEEFDVIWVRLAMRIDRDSIPAEPRCRILASPVTGLDQIDVATCGERGIRVVSLRGETDFLKEIRATSELTIALALALMRNLMPASRSVNAGKWDRDRFRGGELYGKTVGLVGVGRVGTLVAGYLKAFGATVVGYDPRPDYPNDIAGQVATLHELLACSDLVCLLPSYSKSTRHLIGVAEFASMREGAYLINTSRGGVIQEQALLESLRTGRLAGAALDVLDGEPQVDADHPVIQYARDHANLIVVPHIGGNTQESFEKTEVFLASRVVDALSQKAGQAP